MPIWNTLIKDVTHQKKLVFPQSLCAIISRYTLYAERERSLIGLVIETVNTLTQTTSII